jgi:hypothetical protein
MSVAPVPVTTVALPLDGVSATPGPSVSNLGIFTDADLVMRTQGQRIVSQYFAALHQLRQIRRSVSATTLQTSVVTLVLVRLDYGERCVARSSNQPDVPPSIGAAARLIFNLKRSDSKTDALISLH